MAVAACEGDHARSTEAEGADNDLLRTLRAAQMDPRAFEPLYREYAPLVLAYCQRRLNDRHLAEDTMSHIFVKAIHALPRFRPDERRVSSSFRSWLFSIAHNQVVDAYRRHQDTSSLDARGTAQSLSSRDPLPSEIVMASEVAGEVHRCLARLPERQRAVIELRMVGFARRENAETLGMSEAAVRSTQFRGFATLRELLEPWRAGTPNHSATEHDR
jgi:RNA polymerase sigma-70 factor (ECF subfamily)